MIRGADAFLRRVSGMRARLSQAVGRELLTIAEETEEFARESAPEGTPPRDEPRLKDSFSSAQEGLTARVTVSNPHAAYVEFGTGRRGADSPAPPRVGAGGYDSDWAGMAAQPYLYPAAQAARADFGVRLARAAREALSDGGGETG